jgi:GT2 family glycosyltransferase
LAGLTAAVIICAYTGERWDELVGAVASVRAQRVPPQELVVVVDGNAALLARARAELAVTSVVANRHAAGISGARNTGVEATTAPIVGFLDDDAVAEEQWLEAHLEPYEDPTTLGVGGPVLPMRREPPPVWFTDEFNWVVGCTWTGMAAPGGAIRNPVGANFSVRRDVIAAAGGFETRLGRRAGGTGTADETEFCIRALRGHPGGAFRFQPAARVHHHVPPARATWRYYRRRCRVEGAAKAVLTDLAGASAGLESERRYVRSVLPRAVWRELRRRRLLRAGSIVAGLAFTGAAYARGRLALRLAGRR